MEEEAKKDFFQSPPEYQDRTSNGGRAAGAKKYLAIVIFVVVIGLLIFGATKVFKSSNNKIDITPTPTQEVVPSDTPIPTEAVSGTPTPTEKPTPAPKSSSIDKATGLDRSKIAIHVLNGNGTSGVSKKAADFLNGLGYNVVEMGNADNFNYDTTTIQIKAADSKYLPLLKKDLSANYTIGSTSADLSATGRDDAVVIIGKQ